MRVPIAADGATDLLRFALPAPARVFALRAYPPDWSGALNCFALRDVVVNDADAWVGADSAAESGEFCSACAERVAVGSGYGFFVLPSAADTTLIESVSARLRLYDCLTLTAARRSPLSPSELDVSLASWLPPSVSAKLQLPLAVVVASRHVSELPRALETVQQIWVAAGIQIMPEPSLEIAAPEQAVVFSAVDHAALVDLSQRARAALSSSRDAHWPVVVLTPCLRRSDLITHGQTEPWAITPHVPGGAAVGDEPDQLFVAAERCGGLSAAALWSDPAQLGTVIAHELGHYLGLFHVAEADGREDALADTDVSDANLMRATPSPAATQLSASQIAIVRRHSAFAAAP